MTSKPAKNKRRATLLPEPPVQFSYQLETPPDMVCRGFSREVAATFYGSKSLFCLVCMGFFGKHYHLLIGLEEEASLYQNLAAVFVNPDKILPRLQQVWFDLTPAERKLYEVKE